MVVEMHGGRVEAARAGPGLGSEFAIWQPVMIEASTDARRATSKKAPATVRCRVLVVDDEPAVAKRNGCVA